MGDDQRRVFSVVGTLPEPGGYAVAKFSRSARPYQEWIRELTQEGASRFYEQFYFAYGHASIADLAHLTLVAENISIVAAIEILDEQLVDAQESSTRYQDFRRRRYYTPPEISDTPLAAPYAETCDRLFTAYHALHQAVAQHFSDRYTAERPRDMADDEYQRTLRARAFDVARYLLPSSTLTGLGYLCSARTLERQIRRLAGSHLGEIQGIAGDLRRAAMEPAFNPLALRIEPTLDELEKGLRTEGKGLGEAQSSVLSTQSFIDAVREATLSGAAAAPTLVRHTEPSPYAEATLQAARAAANDVLAGIEPDGARGVTLAEPADPTVELAATLLYRASHLSFQQILERLRREARPHPTPLPEGEGTLASPPERGRTRTRSGRRPGEGGLRELSRVDDPEGRAKLQVPEWLQALPARGPHDELVREAKVGYQLIFDLCLDQGAFRDLHRHRNCVQIIQDFTPDHGYDTPDAVVEVGLEDEYRALMDEAGALAQRLDEQRLGLGQYALPLAYRRRALFKMDAAELAYIAEQRTTPAGHFSYREIAYQMYLALRNRYPILAQPIRVTEPAIENFFER